MFAAFFSGSNVALTTAVYAYYAYLSSVEQPVDAIAIKALRSKIGLSHAGLVKSAVRMSDRFAVGPTSPVE